MITLDYNLLKSYKGGQFEVTLINDPSTFRIQKIISQVSDICQDPGELYFWAKLINYPEDLGFFVDWVIISITAFSKYTSIIIDFQAYSDVLRKWEFRGYNSTTFPESVNPKYINDITPLLDRLENLITEIKSNPGNYNKWVINNIPIIYRTGVLDIDDYFKICPEEDQTLSKEEMEEYYNSTSHYIFDNLTIRKYIEIFVSIHSKMTGFPRDRYGGDLEYYQNVTGESDLLQIYPDLDSPSEFFKFCTQIYGKTCRLDLVPTKIRLVPIGVGSHYTYSGLWQIFLNIYDRSYISFALKGWFAKKKEVYLRDEDRITKLLQHKGKIFLMPSPTKIIRKASGGEDIFIEGSYPFDEPDKMEKIKNQLEFVDTLELNGMIRI